MSRISYFQRYSQRENHLTNNTLLALKYFYQASPFKLQDVLNSLLEEELAIGLSFEQQIRSVESVPDAVISQKPLNIHVETKRGMLEVEQLQRHIKGIGKLSAHTESVVLGIAPTELPSSSLQAVEQYATERGVRFVEVSFEDIVEALERASEVYEQTLRDVVEDYRNYLSAEGVLPEREDWLAIFPCGTSYEDNERFGVYYEPASRPSKKDCRFIGIYTNKTASLLGETTAILSYDGLTEDHQKEFGTVSDAELQRVRLVIEKTPYYDLVREPHRFYLVERFFPTKLTKTSSGGMMTCRRFRISELLGGEKVGAQTEVARVAEMLKGKVFE